VGLWFQQVRSNKAEKEERAALIDKLKAMQVQLEIAGRQLMQSDRQHDETRKDLESAINDLKLEIRHIHGDWSDFKEQDLFSREEIWEVIAENDAKRGGRREMPKLKGEWEEVLDRLRDENHGERERRLLPLDFV
jgi:predicted component of type VI protein secretion system